MYYGSTQGGNQQTGGMGYTYNNNNNPYNIPNDWEFDTPQNPNQNQQNTPKYPQTGLTIADAETQNSNTEFILPENMKLGMILLAIFCVLCFFIVLLIKK
jgi:hypothetical protein